jgi:uncharacterized membrane protein YjgN (DUF898 family)
LFKRGWWIWLLSLVVLIVAAALVIGPIIFAVIAAEGRNISEERIMAQALGGVVAGSALAFVLVVVATPFLYGAFKAVQWKWWLEGIRFGEVRATSDLRKGAMISRYWATIGWTLLLFTAFFVFIAIASATMRVGGARMLGAGIEGLADSPIMAGLAILGYLLTIIGINIAVRIYLVRDVWERAVRSVSITGLDSVRDVEAQGELAGALGEGFADGLDVGGL